MPEAGDFITARFKIAQGEVSELLPPCRVSVTWTLVAGRQRTPLSSTVLILGKPSCAVSTNLIPVQDADLFPAPGRYTLVATLDGRDIAEFAFWFLTHQQWLNQIKVERIELMTKTDQGQARLERNGALRWRGYVAFRPLVHFRAEVPGPDVALKFTARLTRGEKVLRAQEFFVRFIRNSQHVWLEQFELSGLGPLAREKHVRLNLTVTLGEQLKAEYPIIILPSENLSNYEGQLNLVEDNLPEDEQLYREIVTQLTARRVARSGKLRFRKWLRSLGLGSDFREPNGE